jgi:hypothetical protein
MAQTEITADGLTVVRAALEVNDTLRLTGRVFEKTEIRGPAVFGLGPANSFISSTFGGPFDAMFWEAPPRPIMGVILLDHCTFRECRFVNVGFVAPAPVLLEIAGKLINDQAFRLSPDSAFSAADSAPVADAATSSAGGAAVVAPDN